MVASSSFGLPASLDADSGLTVSRPITVEDHVRAYFNDEPVLADIAECESQFRQFGTDGKPLQGEKNPYDIGVMQINTLYHGQEAKKLGYDLTDMGDNMAFARHLYEKEGTKPWSSSASCWKNQKLSQK